MKYKVKNTASGFEDLKKKVAEVAKKGDQGKEKYEGLHKLMSSLFDDMMRVNDEVEKTRVELKRKMSIRKDPRMVENSVDSIAEVAESIKSPTEIPIDKKDNRNESVELSLESPEPRSVSPLAKN